LQDRVGRDHLARDQILADTEVLKRTLSLSAPQLVRGHFNHAEAVCFASHVAHVIPPQSVVREAEPAHGWAGRRRPSAGSECRFAPSFASPPWAYSGAGPFRCRLETHCGLRFAGPARL